MPDTIDYDESKRRLIVGEGYVDNVSLAMWEYQVSGKYVLRQWFSYRRRNRDRPIIGDRRPPSKLNAIQPDHWLPQYTRDLLNLLHVLGRLVVLEPKQAELLEKVCDAPLLTNEQLREAGAYSEASTKPKTRASRKRKESPDQTKFLD